MQDFLALLSPLSNFGKDNFISSVIPPFFNSLFWLFGIHGAITSTPIYPYWYKNLDANMAAIAHGVGAANAPRFMTEQFFQWFVYIGGSGTILGLCILLAFMSKSSFGKTLGKAVIIPSIFNINEPIIFGFTNCFKPILCNSICCNTYGNWCFDILCNGSSLSITYYRFGSMDVTRTN